MPRCSHLQRAIAVVVALAVLGAACASGPAPEALAATGDSLTAATTSITSTTTISTAEPTTSTTTSTIEPVPLPTFGPGDAQHDIGWLADQAALVVLQEQRRATAPGAETTLELVGMANLADRVALGLAELGLAFTRSDQPDAQGQFGTNIVVHGDVAAALMRWPILATTNHEGADAVRRQTRQALATGTDVALVPSSDELIDSAKWIVAESARPSFLATELLDAGPGVIAWSNREAQRYVPGAVTFDDSIILSTSSRTTPPDVLELPYDSGMIISRSDVGWATISASVTLPEGDGLWPAIWLLDAEACDAPGRCLGYETPQYYELDLLETRTQQPGEAHLSLHWWDERVRSVSGTAPMAGNGVVVELERRPGLLIWRLDGEVVQVIAERVDTFDSGPHRAGSMHLIVNTAVGGSFTGSDEIGREGAWLGEALVPSSYPAPIDAEFVVSDLRVDSIG